MTKRKQYTIYICDDDDDEGKFNFSLLGDMNYQVSQDFQKSRKSLEVFKNLLKKAMFSRGPLWYFQNMLPQKQIDI